MELEELKAGWEKVSDQIDRQLHVNTKLIHKMTQQQYRSRLSHIAYPELLGSLFLLLMAGALLWNFDRLNTALLRIFGGLSAMLLLAMPVISLQSLRGLSLADVGVASYAETVREFAIRKRRFIRLQRLNKALATPFLIVITPTIVRLLDNKDVTREPNFWLIAIPVSLIVQFLLSRWAIRCYNRSMKQAEALIKSGDFSG